MRVDPAAESGSNWGGSLEDRSARFSETLINDLLMKEEFSVVSALFGIMGEPP
jgi:hypothetical protein